MRCMSDEGITSFGYEGTGRVLLSVCACAHECFCVLHCNQDFASFRHKGMGRVCAYDVRVCVPVCVQVQVCARELYVLYLFMVVHLSSSKRQREGRRAKTSCLQPQPHTAACPQQTRHTHMHTERGMPIADSTHMHRERYAHSHRTSTTSTHPPTFTPPHTRTHRKTHRHRHTHVRGAGPPHLLLLHTHRYRHTHTRTRG
jgi:hypothetical protein